MADPPESPKCDPISAKKATLLKALACPITLELPVEPVTAEDGQIYERVAIKRYFRSKEDLKKAIPSPVNREKSMGTKLLDARQHRKTIEKLVQEGIIWGDAVTKWKKKRAKVVRRAQLLKKAEQGDIKVMEEVLVNYYNGKHGFEEDHDKAYYWSKQAHAAGSIFGTAVLGDLLLRGGRTKNQKLGFTHLRSAAEKGSNFAAFRLAGFFARGQHGVPFNKNEAKRYLKMAIEETCTHDHMDAADKQLAQDTWDQLAAKPRQAAVAR